MIYQNLLSIKDFVFKRDFSFKENKNTPKVLFFIPTQSFLNFRETSNNSIIVKNNIVDSMYSEIENQFNSFLTFGENINAIKKISQNKEKDFILLRNSFESGISQRKETLENISFIKRLYDIIDNKKNNFFGEITKNLLLEFSRRDDFARSRLFFGSPNRNIFSKDFRPISRSEFNIDLEVFNSLTGFEINNIKKLDEHSFIVKSFLDLGQNIYASNDLILANENFKSFEYDHENNVFNIGANINNSIFDFISGNEYFDYKKFNNTLFNKNVLDSIQSNNFKFNANINNIGVEYNKSIDYQQISDENKNYIEAISNPDFSGNFSFKKFIRLVLNPSQLNNVENLYIVSSYSGIINEETNLSVRADLNIDFISNIFEEKNDFFKLDFGNYNDISAYNSSSDSYNIGDIYASRHRSRISSEQLTNIKKFYDAKINYHIENPYNAILYDFKPIFLNTDNRTIQAESSIENIVESLKKKEIVSQHLSGNRKTEYKLEKINEIEFDRYNTYHIIDSIVKKTKIKSIENKNIDMSFVKEIIGNVKKRSNNRTMIPYLVDDFKDLSVINKNDKIFKFLFTESGSGVITSNISFDHNKKIGGFNFISKETESKVDESFIKNVTDFMSNYYIQGDFMSSSILYDSILKDFQDFQENKEIETKLNSSDIISMCLYFNYIHSLEKKEEFAKNNIVDMIVKRFLKNSILRNKNKDFNKKTIEFLFDINKWIPVEGKEAKLTLEEAKRVSTTREKSSASLSAIQNNVFEKENIKNLSKKTCNLQSNIISFSSTTESAIYQVLVNNVLPFVQVINPKLIQDQDLKKLFNYDFVVKKDIKFKTKEDNKVSIKNSEKYENIVSRLYIAETEEEKDMLLNQELFYDDTNDVYSDSRFLEIQDSFDNLFDKSSIFAGLESKIISLINLVDKKFVSNSDLNKENKVDSFIAKNSYIVDLTRELLKVYSFIFMDFIKKSNIDVAIKTFKNYQENIKIKELVTSSLTSLNNLNDKYFVDVFKRNKITNAYFNKVQLNKPTINQEYVLETKKIRKDIKEKYQEIVTNKINVQISNSLSAQTDNKFGKEIIETYGLLLKSDFRQSFNMDLIRMILLYAEDTQNAARMIFNQDLNRFIQYFNLITEEFYRDINDANYIKKIKKLIKKQEIRNSNNRRILESFNTLDNRDELLSKNFFENIKLERKFIDTNILENKNVLCVDCTLDNLVDKDNLLLINITPVDLNDDNKCYLPVLKVFSTNLLNLDINNQNNEIYYVDNNLKFVNITSKNDYNVRSYDNIKEKIESVLKEKLLNLSLEREQISFNIEEFYLKKIFEDHFQSNNLRKAIKAKLDLDLYDYGEINTELVTSIINSVSEESFTGVTGDISRQSFLNSLNSDGYNFQKEMALGLSSILSNNVLTEKSIKEKDTYEMFLIDFEEKNLKFFTLNEAKSNYTRVELSSEEKALMILNEINPEDLNTDKINLYTDNSTKDPVLNFYVRIEVI